MPALPPTSRLLDTAEEIGFNVKYDENCGTCKPGLVTITGKHLRGPVVVEVECARSFGLVFRSERSTYRTLTCTADVLGISL